MSVSLRTRLVLAIGVPFLIVYGAMSWLLAVRWRHEAMNQLEAVAVERVSVLAGRLDDRVRMSGPEAVTAAVATTNAVTIAVTVNITNASRTIACRRDRSRQNT